MSSVTHRAEQALLGALLTDPHPALGDLRTAVDQLRTDDFGQRMHQHLFTAITDLSGTRPDLHGDDFIEAVATRVALPGAEPERLRALAQDAPNPAHATAYARMIQTSAFRREVAGHAERIALAAAATATRAGSSSPAIRQQQEHQALLAAALTRQAQVYATFTTAADTINPGTETSSAITPSARAEDLPASSGEPAEPSVNRRRADLEDQVLADLLHNPDQVEILARFLPEDTFSTDQRREIYQTMLMAAVDGGPIDEVIIAWTLEDNRAGRRLYPSPDPTTAQPPVLDTDPAERPGEPDIVYLTRLAGTVTINSTAVLTGRQLLADDLRTQLTHSHVHADARATTTLTGSSATGPQPLPAALDPGLRPPAPPTPAPASPTLRTDR
jgi:DnaB helicase-like protein